MIKNLTIDKQVSFFTVGSVEVQDFEKSLEHLALEKQNDYYVSDRYCDSMKFVYKKSGEKIFLNAQCNCEYCAQKLSHDLKAVGSPVVSLNCTYESEMTPDQIFSKNNFKKSYEIDSYISCISGDAKIKSLKTINDDINITIAKKDNKMIIGIPSIDILY